MSDIGDILEIIRKDGTFHDSEMDIMNSPKNTADVQTQHQGEMDDTEDGVFIDPQRASTQSLEEQVISQVCGYEGQNPDCNKMGYPMDSSVWPTNSGVPHAYNNGTYIADAVQLGDATPGITDALFDEENSVRRECLDADLGNAVVRSVASNVAYRCEFSVPIATPDGGGVGPGPGPTPVGSGFTFIGLGPTSFGSGPTSVGSGPISAGSGPTSAGTTVVSEQCASSVVPGEMSVDPPGPNVYFVAPRETSVVMSVGTGTVGSTVAVSSGGVNPAVPRTAMLATPTSTPATINVGPRKTKKNTKLKLHQIKTPFSDPVMEKKRLQAIKAWKNREKKKAEMKKLRSQFEEDRKEKRRLNDEIRQLKATLQEKISEISQYQSILQNLDSS